jgi:hypothetical protein
MINVEKAITNKFPTFANRPALLRKPTLTLLKKLIYENEINDFLRSHTQDKGFNFVDRVFEFLTLTTL